MERFKDALIHCMTTDQKPTEWIFSEGIKCILYQMQTFPLKDGFSFLELPISFDENLPLNKVVLKAGQNSVAAFVVPLSIDLDN